MTLRLNISGRLGFLFWNNSYVASHLTRRTADIDKPETRRLLGDANRLRGMLETQLGRGFLPDISPPAVVPLGSPALQRKSGYCELLHF